MDTMNRFRSLIWSAALTVAVLFTASPLFAQTALTTTTLGAAIDNVQQSLTVASATGITAQGTGATFQYLPGRPGDSVGARSAQVRRLPLP
jgi:hypothetical protein